MAIHINQKDGYISVYGDGANIPIQKHKEYDVYVPELIFSHLLTYDKKDEKCYVSCSNWKIGIVVNDGVNYVRESFVNDKFTYFGGSHVNNILN